MLHRSISYGLVPGLGTVALAVLLFGARSGTNGDPETAPGLGAAPSHAVLGDQSTPNTGPTTINENLPAICPNTEFAAYAGALSTAPTPAEPTPNAAVRRFPPPCIHAVAWFASPVP
jgi:hypothetical protein